MVEIDTVNLEKIVKGVYTAIISFLKSMTLHIKKLDSPSHKNDMCKLFFLREFFFFLGRGTSHTNTRTG